MKKLLVLFLLSAAALAQTVAPYRSPRATFTDSNGFALAGGCVFTYAGGTSTPLATYTDYTGGTSNPNPVPLDSTGSAVMWLGAAPYKFAVWSNGGVNCATGAFQWSVDQVPGDQLLNAVISGSTFNGGNVAGAAITGGTISGTAIAAGTVDSTPIGQTTPSSGSFTTITGALNTLSFNSTPVFNASAFSYFTMSLTNNVTSSSITGGTTGQSITLDICQNATGGYTFAWPPNLIGAPVGVNPAPAVCTEILAFNNGGYWYTVWATTPSTQSCAILACIVGAYDNLTFSATPVFNASVYAHWSMLLSANVTSVTMSGGLTGEVVTFDICQNATGGYTFAWPPDVLNAPVVNTAAGSCTGAVAVSENTNWVVVASTSSTGTNPPSVLPSTFSTSSTTPVATGLAFSAIPGAAGSYTGRCTLYFSGTSTSNPMNVYLETSAAAGGVYYSGTYSYGAAATYSVPPATQATSAGGQFLLNSLTPAAGGTLYPETFDITFTSTGANPETLSIYLGVTSTQTASLAIGSMCKWY